MRTDLPARLGCEIEAAGGARGSNEPGGLSGFTLIEMIVTIGIIIMAAGFLAPALGTMFANRKLENAGTMISSVMNEARNESVTKKQAHSVVFLQNGLRLYREPKGEDPGGYRGKIRPYDPDNSGTMKYHLYFAGAEFEDIAKDIRSVIVDDEQDPEAWTLDSSDIYLTFRPDGTIDFRSYTDVPSYEFRESPPIAADIVIERLGDLKQKGYIDIRPTGRTVFKLEEIELK